MNESNENLAGFQHFNNTTLTRVVDKITITRGSQFNFPTAMYKKNKLDKFKAARLFLNKADSKVGIEFINELEDGSFKLIPSGENGKYGAYAVAKSFFFLNDIEPLKYAGRYDYEKINLRSLGADRGGIMFIIDLKTKEGDLGTEK